MVLQLRCGEEGLTRLIAFLAGRQLGEGGQRGLAAFGGIGFGEDGNRPCEQVRRSVHRGGFEQDRNGRRGNIVACRELRDDIGDQVGIVVYQREQAVECVVRLDPVELHLAGEEGRFGRRRFGQRRLEGSGDLRRLAPSFRLIVGPAGVGAGAPGIALPGSFVEMQSAQRA